MEREIKKEFKQDSINYLKIMNLDQSEQDTKQDMKKIIKELNEKNKSNNLSQFINKKESVKFGDNIFIKHRINNKQLYLTAKNTRNNQINFIPFFEGTHFLYEYLFQMVFIIIPQQEFKENYKLK